MIRWAVAIFFGLTVFYVLLPFLRHLGVGRMPGDVTFRWRRVVICLPFGSTVLWSLIAFALAELFSMLRLT